MSLFPARTKNILSKMMAIECSQHFSHCKSISPILSLWGIFQTFKGSLLRSPWSDLAKFRSNSSQTLWLSSPGRLRVSCVPMREQKKNDEKGYFFRAGKCAALSSFSVGKSGYFCRKRVCFFFTSLLKRCLVVTELRKKQYSIVAMYTVSVQYTKVAEVLESMRFN